MGYVVFFFFLHERLTCRRLHGPYKFIRPLQLTSFQMVLVFAVWHTTLKLPLHTLARKVFFICFALSNLQFGHIISPVLLVIYMLIPNCQGLSLKDVLLKTACWLRLSCSPKIPFNRLLPPMPPFSKIFLHCANCSF